ncbi:two-component system, sensor histidine kinase YesM [Paenibacillus sp. 1_12]|uniref:sensor histidine kinase n=1 Tax=Paenibacillus sp. 1_12 TaxID=1566278 RepID=UPI0008E7D41D|nr:sensor histidine kinase [Paenibacillus sp. 1_12]SFK83390.1 two-component system, sensor histidine kinase YesM [Paenibacillus sp. 1_12]
MNRLFKKLSKLSLRQKIMFSIIACLIAPPIIAIQVSDYFTRDVLREQAATNAQESLDVANLYVSDLMNSMIYMTNNIQFDNETATVMKKLGQQPLDPALIVMEGKYITNKLETLVFSKDHMYISVLLPNGAYFTNYSGSEFNPQQFRSEPWFTKLDQMTEYDIHWVGTHPNYIGSRTKVSPYVVTMARVLKTGGSKPYAYVILSAEEQMISDFFNKYAPTQKMMLTDSTGTILASTDNQQIGTVFSQMEANDQSKTKFLLMDKQEYILLNEPLPISGWHLISLVSYQTAIEKIQNIRKNDYWAQFIFLIIFIVFLFWIINRITKPLVVLARVASSVKAGTLNARADIRGSDEIGRLGQVFNQMLDRIELMIEQITEEQTRKRMLELELLQAQINPHFLFNLLNSIRMKIRMRGDRESADLISSLSKLLRMTINRNNEFLPVHMEVDTVRHYVKLMNVRHNQKIQFEECVVSNVLMENIPRFTIQPFIENAFIHGLNQKYGHITLSIWKEDTYLFISVQDDGVGIGEEKMDDLKKSLSREANDSKSRINGIGLKNVHDRLALIYGISFHMDIQSDTLSGTAITIKLPLHVKGDE